MLSHSTTETILNLVTADRGATVAEIEALRKFLAAGCIGSGPARIHLEDGMLLTKSAAARFLGVSRQIFRIMAEKIIIVEGKPRPQFLEHFIAHEKFCRYSKIDLIEYLAQPHPAPPEAASPDRPAFQIAC